MLLSELIRERFVLTGLPETEKMAVLDRMLDFLVEEGGLQPDEREPVSEAVIARERFMSTGMEHGIALPHGVTDAIDEELACVAICPQGLTFESIDRKPTHIIILLLTPLEKSLTRVRTISKIARVIDHEETRERLIQADTPQDVVDVIVDAEKKRGLR